MNKATPSAPPASPAAGWIQMSLERTLAQEAAVGHAVQRHAARQAQVLQAGLPCTWRAMRSMISSVTTWIEAARSISRCVSGDSGCRGGPPNSRSNFGARSSSARGSS